jgi:hypothetical protein
VSVTVTERAKAEPRGLEDLYLGHALAAALRHCGRFTTATGPWFMAELAV